MEEDPRKQNWSSCMKVMDKHQTELNKLSPQLKSRSQKNFLQQNLCESEMRRLKEDALNENVTFQEKLLEAQMAVNSTEMFLPLFKVTIAAMTNVCNLPTSDIIKISKQEDLLIKELETLKHVKELLLHLLRTTEHKEISSKHIDVLMHKLTESENENDGLRKEMLITERRIVELSSRLQLEKANALKADHLSKSVGAVHSHLQCQIQKKEAENDQLKAKIQITKLLEDLKKIQDHGRNSNEEICGKLTSISSEKANIHLENAKLKALLTALEDNTVATEAELLDLQEEVKQQENLAEQYKTEVQKLQTEAEELKTRYEKVLNENKLITEAKDLEISEVRSQMQAHLKELEHVRDLQKAAEERLQEYQENMLSYRRSYADKSKTIRELQVQIDNNNRFLRKNSLEDEKYNIEKKYEYLKRQLEKMDVQNQELAHQLANQEESLQHTELQLKEKLAEYDALARQLEAALEEGRKKESEEVEKMSSKERALQTKILALETELRERREERKRLVSKLNNGEKASPVLAHSGLAAETSSSRSQWPSEKQQQVCLKELEHNLQKSENQTHSIQNYVQFLKNSYVTMFG
ncbi:protein BCAP isoform X6 [Pelodiscus sinensis]|uniref:protein BCAP isoform X6 n=1 Tax=Pelodiscus sinensis TaxID=13735 RepID=UPI003F6B1625